MVTLEWARLEPAPGKPDPAALESALTLLQSARDQGLRVWACLVDGTLPGWFADDEGGFDDERARTLLWPRHIDRLGEQVGHLVDGWVPQREPVHWALRRNLLGTATPGRREPKRAATAVANAILADGEAWRLLRGTAPVATYQTARAVVPTVDDVRARPQAAAVEHLLWDSWILAVTEGVLDVGNRRSQVDHLRGAFDRVVVALRPAVRIDQQGRWHPHPGDRPAGPSGLVALPELQLETLRRAADKLDQPLVAAGDLADVTDDGRARPDHVQAVLEGTIEAAGETTVAGWWQTSPIDGYQWERGFTLHPGLIDRQRNETDAAATFRELLSGGAGK
jgi:beta-glucosidase